MLSFNFDPFPEIRTKRLCMRRLTVGDKDAFFELRTDPVVNRYIERPQTKSIQEVIALIKQIDRQIKSNDAIFWVITLNRNDRMLGSICFWNIRKEDHRAEIGYVLHPKYHRQGIMQEAMEATLDYGFKEMRLHSIEANVNPHNLASIRLLERNGFIREAYFKENIYFDGKFLDTAIYSLLSPVN